MTRGQAVGAGFLALILTTATAHAATKRALLIAVGEYPHQSGYVDLSSGHDAEIIAEALFRQGFARGKIKTLRDKEATADGIRKAIDHLISAARTGDIIYLQYSGHGHQIADDNGDEFDGLDEVLAPFGAPAKPDEDYTGDRHIRDDQVGRWLTSLRQKVGPEGNVIMVVDACFSGTISRGKKSRPARFHPVPIGKATQSSREQRDKEGGGLDSTSEPANETLAPHVVFSAARQFEPANETSDSNGEGVGALTLALAEELERIQEGTSYRALFRSVRRHMARTVPHQRPLIEGDQDTAVFSGDVVAQAAFYKVGEIVKDDKVLLLGGQISGLAKGTRVELHPAGSRGPGKTDAVASGTITEARGFVSDLALEAPIKELEADKLWAFVTHQTFPGLQVRTHIDVSVKGKTRTALQSQVCEMSTAVITRSMAEADVLISMQGEDFQLMDTSTGEPLHTQAFNSLGAVSDRLRQHSRARFLRGMDLRDPDRHIQISLTSCEGSADPADNRVKVGANFALQLKNTGKFEAHIAVLWVSKNDKIEPLIPGRGASHIQDHLLHPGGQARFPTKGCLIADPPAGQELIKVFATEQPIDFSPIFTPVKTRGPAPALHPLADLLSDGNTTTRSGGVVTEGAHVQSVIIDLVD